MNHKPKFGESAILPAYYAIHYLNINIAARYDDQEQNNRFRVLQGFFFLETYQFTGHFTELSYT